MYDGCDPRRLGEILTCDDTWIHYHQPNGNAFNKFGVGKSGNRHIITKRENTSKRFKIVLGISGLMHQNATQIQRNIIGKCCGTNFGLQY
jgi:hypothetical protein